MRRLSKKRQSLSESITEWRNAFRSKIGRCEWCGKRMLPILHEITRGYCDRRKSLMEPSVILALCDPGCHQIVDKWPRSKQFALLRLKRPQDFNLEVVWRISARRWPDLEEIMVYYGELKHES